MVSTGDHWDDSVSRQMAPCTQVSRLLIFHYEPSMTDCLTGDVGMPDLSLELHDWGTEGVFSWDPDIDMIGPTLVW